MAGTGHGYEISNVNDVSTTLNWCAAMFDDVEGFGGPDGWFHTKAFLKFLTSENFVFRIRRDNADSFLEETDPEERDFVSAKLEAGGDVRRFSRDQFRNFGPDVRHAADYARYLARTNPRGLRKASRMAPAEFFARVRRWVPARSVRTSLPEGATALVKTTSAGRRWLELLDMAALRREGARMSHCVGDGGYRTVQNGGRSRIFSLRDTEDRPLVTVETDDRDPAAILQIKAFGNESILPGARECLCELMNQLGAHTDTADVAFAHVAFVEGKGWRPIEQVWRQMEICGMDAMVDGRVAILMSPVRPGVALLRGTGLRDWWREGDHRGLSVAMADRRNWHIEEVRAVCRFLDEFQVNNPLDYGPRDQRIVLMDGRHVPFVDAIERRLAGDVEYFVLPDGNTVVYQSSSRTVPLLEVGRKPVDRYGSTQCADLYAMPCNLERWNATDTRRCLEVMTHLDVKDFRTGLVADDWSLLNEHSSEMRREIDSLKKRYEIRRTEEGRWHSFLLEAVREEARTIDGEWLVGPSMCRLVTDAGGRGRVYDFSLKGGAVTSVAAWIYSDAVLKEMADFMNRRKLPCSDRFSTFEDLLPKKRGELGRIRFLAGKWRVLRSQRDLAVIFRRRDPSISDAAAFAMLPIAFADRLRSCDRLFRTLAPLWAEMRLRNGSLRMYASAGRRSFIDDSVDWAWQAVHWLIDNRELMTAPVRKKFVRELGEHLVGLSHAASCLGSGRHEQDEAGLLLRKLMDELPAGVLDKAARSAFRRRGFFHFRDENDLPWLDLLPRLTKDATARLIRSEANSALYGASRVDTEGKASVIAACAEICVGDYFFDSRIGEMRSRADDLENTGQTAAASILRQGADRAEVARQEAVERRRREREEWEARFARRAA